MSGIIIALHYLSGRLSCSVVGMLVPFIVPGKKFVGLF
jgi:hypothetical protein